MHGFKDLNDTVFSFNATSLFSVQSILKKHEDAFFEVVNAKHNVLRLQRKGVVSEDVAADIKAKGEDEAKEVLYDHLMKHANVGTLKKWYEWAKAAAGFPNMQELGKELEVELALVAGQVCVVCVGDVWVGVFTC